MTERRLPLPSTLGSFDWKAMPWSPSGTDRYWQLAWALLREQMERLALDGIAWRDEHFGEPGAPWTPAVDLALGDRSTVVWLGGERFTPARDVRAIAAGAVGKRILRGTVVRLRDVIPDGSWEGLGTNYWSIDDAELGVPFLQSALEGRWGGAAMLADALIVPVDHPIVGDDVRADRLVLDLQDITRAFRVAHRLPAEGESASPTDEPPKG